MAGNYDHTWDMSGEKRNVFHMSNGGGQVFYLWRMCVECCLASAMKETQAGQECESFTVLSNQRVFRVQESIYRDGKQNR